MKHAPITHPAPAGPRPKCKGCGRTLKAEYRTIWERREIPGGVTPAAVARRFGGWSGHLGFCTKDCALLFAAAAYDAGYRRRTP